MRYDDIINLDGVELDRPRMSIEKRAGIFAPFSALVGYKEEISETSRVVADYPHLSNDKIQCINRILYYVNNHLDSDVFIKYYIKDSKKSGVHYKNYSGKIKKIDIYNKNIYLNNLIIDFNNIVEIKLI